MGQVINMSKSQNYPVISLFSGAMGLDLGLEQAGLDIRVSQDYDKWCIETIRKNGHMAIEGDIRALIEDDPSCSFLLNAAGIKDDVFAIVGGPPCQAYSTAGKRQGIADDRGSLYMQYWHVVEKLRPRFFVMENVKGLLSMPRTPGDKSSGALIETILRQFRSLGYHTIHGLLDAVHYGVPQFRERLIIVGSRDNEPIFMPTPTHFHIHQNPDMRWKTLWDAIGDIQTEQSNYAKFSPTIAEYLSLIPEGGNWKSLSPALVEKAMGGAYKSGGGKVGFYRRLSFKEPSPTLVTSPIQKATMLCHPRELRALSVREYARIQQFPDTWQFEGSLANCYKQIGNAVPLGLGTAIGQMLVAVAEGNSEIKVKRTRGTSVHNKFLLNMSHIAKGA